MSNLLTSFPLSGPNSTTVAQIPQKITSRAVTVTAAEAREWFRLHGISITKWARHHGFPPAQVYAVLGQRTRGDRGDAHRIAVALGIKDGVVLPPGAGLDLKPSNVAGRVAASENNVEKDA